MMTSIPFYYVIFKLDVIHFRDTDRLYHISRPYEKMIIYIWYYGVNITSRCDARYAHHSTKRVLGKSYCRDA